MGIIGARLRFQTDVRDGLELSLTIVAHREGPLRILGEGWRGGENMLLLRAFEVNQRKERTLNLFVRGLGDMSLEPRFKCSVPELQITTWRFAARANGGSWE